MIKEANHQQNFPSACTSNEFLTTFGRTEGTTTFLLTDKLKLIAFPTVLLEPFLGDICAGQSLRIQIQTAPEQDSKNERESALLHRQISAALAEKRPEILQLEKATSNWISLRISSEIPSFHHEQQPIQRILLANGKHTEFIWSKGVGNAAKDSIQIRGLSPNTEYEFVYLQRFKSQNPQKSAPLKVKTASDNEYNKFHLWIPPFDQESNHLEEMIQIKEWTKERNITCTFTLNAEVTHAFVKDEQLLSIEDKKLLEQLKIPFLSIPASS